MKDLTLELTDKCYNQCIHCSSSCKSNTKNNFLQMDNLGMILNAAKALRFDTVILSGGEPLLHPEFTSIVKQIKLLGFKIKVYSSGVLDIEDYGQVGKMLEDVDVVAVSQHAIDPATHAIVSGREKNNGYRESQLFIDMLIHFNVPFEINTVLMKINAHHIIPLYNKYRTTCTRFNVLKLVEQGNVEHHRALTVMSDHKSMEAVLFYLEGKPKVKLSASFAMYDKKHNQYFCEVGYAKMCITPDGYFIPCEVYKECRTHFRKIEEYGSINDIILEMDNWKAVERYGCITSKHKVGSTCVTK